ncbi:MAG: galactokinase [Brevinema sp.]
MDINFSEIKQKLTQEFFNQYQYNQDLIFTFAPGRVNIIGEHTDYNGGNVFPIAINMGTFLAIAPRTDKIVRCYSMNFPEIGVLEFSLENLPQSTDWNKFLIASIKALKDQHHKILEHGFDIIVYGNIPDGAGLSSSASLEVAIIYALNSLYQLALDQIQIALTAQKAEHIVGVNCGIMDQFASAMGKKDHAILLDCNTLKYTYVPFDLGTYSLIIIDSKKQRQLHDSKYNERRAECEKAIEYLYPHTQITHLGELSEQQFEKYQQYISDSTILKRAKHAVSENQRTLYALDSLRDNDIFLLGELLNASHLSLKDDYEVTGVELDTLTEIIRSYPGVLGARMTGAGFGGCCIAIVPTPSVESLIEFTQKEYFQRTHLQAQFYRASAEDGAHHF